MPLAKPRRVRWWVEHARRYVEDAAALGVVVKVDLGMSAGMSYEPIEQGLGKSFASPPPPDEVGEPQAFRGMGCS